MIYIKTAEEIEKMRVAGRLAASVLEMIGPYVRAGVTTGELNDICHDYMVSTLDTTPASLNYKGFPKSMCTSVNHQVCHGIPGKRKLKDGDILNVDVALIKDGYYGDTSKMFTIGTPSVIAKHVNKVAHECLWIGINMVKPGVHLGDIGKAIQQHAETNRCSVVREFCGHGLGRHFHEDPNVLHFYDPTVGPGAVLEPNMTFTIEPMVNAGKHHIRILPDKWTVVTRDHSLSAQWEHSLRVTDTGVEVLTLREEEKVNHPN